MKIKRFLPLLLIPFLSGCHVVPNTYNYNDADKYVAYTASTQITNQITDLEINYVSGSVTVEKGEQFKIEESQHDYPCYYWNNTETKKFTVQFVQNGLDLDNKTFTNKHLTITVPENLKTFSLNLISARFEVNEFKINTVSGTGRAILGSNKKTDINTVSGNVNLKVISTLEEENINIESVSGDIILVLDERRGFNLRFDSISGEPTNEFGEPTNPDLSKFSINMDSISGDLSIYKEA